MRAIGFSNFGDAPVMGILDLPEPHPGPTQVRIRVAAADINISDAMARSFTEAAYHEVLLHSPERAAELRAIIPVHTGSYVLGWDAAGVVDEIGSDVEYFAPGDAVIAVVQPVLDRGAQAEFIVVDVQSVVLAPRGRSFVESSTLLMNALTARLALGSLQLTSGDAIAVTGAAGAVGGYAVQLAKSQGLRVVADAKAGEEDLIAGLGADLVFPRGAEFAAHVNREVGAVQGVVDAAKLGDAVVDAVADGGKIFSPLGFVGSTDRGVSWTHRVVAEHIGDTRVLAQLRDAAEAGALTLRVARTFLPEQAAEAHQLLEAGGVRGRLVFTL